MMPQTQVADARRRRHLARWPDAIHIARSHRASSARSDSGSSTTAFNGIAKTNARLSYFVHTTLARLSLKLLIPAGRQLGLPTSELQALPLRQQNPMVPGTVVPWLPSDGPPGAKLGAKVSRSRASSGVVRRLSSQLSAM